MADLAAETKEMGFKLEQVQDFTPTPMTVATVYITQSYPYTLKPYKTVKKSEEKRDQKSFSFGIKEKIKNGLKKT